MHPRWAPEAPFRLAKQERCPEVFSNVIRAAEHVNTFHRGKIQCRHHEATGCEAIFEDNKAYCAHATLNTHLPHVQGRRLRGNHCGPAYLEASIASSHTNPRAQRKCSLGALASIYSDGLPIATSEVGEGNEFTEPEVRNHNASHAHCENAALNRYHYRSSIALEVIHI